MNCTQLEWNTAAAAMPGQLESGDLFLACAIPDGMLFAAIDGLGHGAEAAVAARAAVEALEQHASEPVITLLKHCHDALLTTRGAAVSLAALNTRYGTMTWIGVGNVAGVLLRTDNTLPTENLLLRSGVVGYQMPLLQAAVLPINAGDLLIFTTDGLLNDFA